MKLSFCAVGDTSFHRHFNRDALEASLETSTVLADLGLSSADIVFVNAETATSFANRSSRPECPIFTPSEHFPLFTRLNTTVACLANNHTMDEGIEGLASLLQRFQRLGIATVGAGLTVADARRPLLLERRGVSLGFIATVDRASFFESVMRRHCADETQGGVNALTPREVIAQIGDLQRQVDHVIVSVHGGDMFGFLPSEQMRRNFLCYLDAGASIVLGHHAHTCQGLLVGPTGYAALNLGNFIFPEYPYQLRLSSHDVVERSDKPYRREEVGAVFRCLLDKDSSGAGSLSYSCYSLDRGLTFLGTRQLWQHFLSNVDSRPSLRRLGRSLERAQVRIMEYRRSLSRWGMAGSVRRLSSKLRHRPPVSS
jgi:hypothetical protein